MELYQQKKEEGHFIITEAPSCQTFADASMRKIVPKSCGSHFEGIDERPLFVLRPGPRVTIIFVKLSDVVGKIA